MYDLKDSKQGVAIIYCSYDGWILLGVISCYAARIVAAL